VFFESPIGLTRNALNDAPINGTNPANGFFAKNVYEYHEGHVYLISDGKDTANGAGSNGTATSAVKLLGADASGANVFFTTADALVPADTDTGVDVYDARICTPASPCISPATPPSLPCLGEECHGIPAGTPAPPSAPSATFNGQGNITPPLLPSTLRTLTRAQKLANALKACKKDKRKAKRKTCEVSAHKKYGPVKQKKANKASNDRRGN
jgi:hypothetical protein